MAEGPKETRTADGMLVVSQLPGHRWAVLVLGAILCGVPLARLIDGPGGLAAPTATSFLMAVLGVLTLMFWLIPRAIDEQMRKGLRSLATEPDGPLVTVHPSWIVRAKVPALGAYVTDRGAPVGWVPIPSLDPRFSWGSAFALVGTPAPKRASLLRSRTAGQVIVGVIEPPDQTAHQRHPLAPHAEALMGWAPPVTATLAGARDFEPVAPAPGAPAHVDPDLRRAAISSAARFRTVGRVTSVVASVVAVVMMGNAAGTAGIGVSAGLIVLMLAARPARAWAEKPLCDRLAATTGLPKADLRTLSRMLHGAGLGQVSAGPPS